MQNPWTLKDIAKSVPVTIANQISLDSLAKAVLDNRIDFYYLFS